MSETVYTEPRVYIAEPLILIPKEFIAVQELNQFPMDGMHPDSFGLMNLADPIDDSFWSVKAEAGKVMKITVNVDSYYEDFKLESSTCNGAALFDNVLYGENEKGLTKTFYFTIPHYPSRSECKVVLRGDGRRFHYYFKIKKNE